MQHFCFCPHFSWAELKDLRLFLCRQKAYFSQILFTNLSKSVLVRGIRKPVSIWCDHHLPSPSHRVDQVVDCGLWNVGPLLFNGCAKLLDIGRNWNTMSYTPIQSIPNMLNGWHVRWVCWPCKNWDVFSFQELFTDPCNMGPCIIMLQHEVMVVDEWRNNGPQDLVTVSLCIQNAINKMHLCSLSITYACPYHNSIYSK